MRPFAISVLTMLLLASSAFADPTVDGITPHARAQVAPGFEIVVNTHSDPWFGEQGIRSVKFYVDGADVKLDTEAPYTYVASPFIAAGWHKLQVLIIGNDGSTTTREWQVEVINTEAANGPVVTIVSPGAGSRLEPGFVIDAKVTAARGVQMVKFMINGDIVDSQTRPPFKYQTKQTMALGDKRITVWASDLNGVSSYTTINVTAARGNDCVSNCGGADTVAPTITEMMPTEGSAVDKRFTIKANATDNVRIKEAVLFIDGVRQGRREGKGPWTFQASDDRAPGSHYYEIEVSDGVNKTRKRVNITIKASAGDTSTGKAPRVTRVSPEDGDNVDPGFQVKVEAMDEVGVTEVKVLIDNKPIGTKTKAPWVFTAPDDLENGEHSLTVIASNGKKETEYASVFYIGDQEVSEGSEDVPEGGCSTGVGSPLLWVGVALLARRRRSRRECTSRN